MSISVKFDGTIAHIVLSGKIDYSIQDELRKENNKALTADHIREFHVNLADVTFLDSSGIRALLMLQKKADANGKSVVLLNCSQPIRETLEVGGFNTVFTIR